MIIFNTDIFQKDFPLIQAILNRDSSVKIDDINTFLQTNISPYLTSTEYDIKTLAQWILYEKQTTNDSIFKFFIKYLLTQGKTSFNDNLFACYFKACEANQIHIMSFLETLYSDRLDITSEQNSIGLHSFFSVSASSQKNLSDNHVLKLGSN